jgi:hypothetical protein
VQSVPRKDSAEVVERQGAVDPDVSIAVRCSKPAGEESRERLGGQAKVAV